MAAIDTSLLARSENTLNELVKRKNWAGREPGVVLVFCIIGALALLLVGIYVHKKLSERRARKAAQI
jgi:hypothetical protein